MSMKAPVVAAVVVAAGSGLRAGGGVPKQYRLLAGRPVLSRTIDALCACPAIDQVVIVINPEYRQLYDLALDNVVDARKLLLPAEGGASRQASVRAGLEALASFSPDVVLVHDGVRCFVDDALIKRTLAGLGPDIDGAIPALPVTDTIKTSNGGRLTGTVDRSSLRAVQTPQAFRFAPLLMRHRDLSHRDDLTDDAALFEEPNGHLVFVDGAPENVKLTTPGDFAAAELRLSQRRTVRTGIGYDVHAFTSGDQIALGGVLIPHDRGVLAHSDGDVALHAATDAILGALGDGDIGTHFPPSDPQWRGVRSERFLAYAANLVRKRGGTLTHLDITIVCEAPRIGPHRAAMTATIATSAGVSNDRVSIKATTSERLGFTGRSEGLAAMAVATLEMPQ
jgi:2-C-methyl-D-erythritol 4-phosphate cytidylyltransferase / 2-C-methyl-D-erythritol 2,4-cyclodiphosphate synthase